MKSTLVMAAGCLIAALAVGDTVYRISPKTGTLPPQELAKIAVPDLNDSAESEEEMGADLDSLFAHNKNIDLDIAGVRELAMIAKPHASHWGDQFYKQGAKGVANVSGFTKNKVTGCWDPTLDHFASAGAGPYAHSGWGTGLSDEYSLSPTVSGNRFYGGGTGSAYASRRHHSPSHTASKYCPPTGGPGGGPSVPEPASLSLVMLGAAGLLRRRRRAE